MIAQQMHIQFGLGFQKLGANSRRKFYPQEIDALLNRSMDQFIADQVKVTTDAQGFEQVQIDVDKIRPLIVRDTYMSARYVPSVATGYRRYKSELPGDYAYLISDVWSLVKKCDTTVSSSSTLHAYVIPVADSTKVDAPYYNNVKLHSQNFDLELATAIPYGAYTGYPSKKDKYRVIELLLETFYELKHRPDKLAAMNSYDLYWERAGELYYPGHLIMTSTVSETPTFVVDTTSQEVLKLTITGTYDTAGPVWSPYAGRLTKASAIDNLLTTPYYKPLPTSPLTLMTEGMVHVYSPASHIVNGGTLTYIRKAARIDLSLQRNCELAPDFHQYIVDKAVEYAAGRVESPNLYQAAATENSKQ